MPAEDARNAALREFGGVEQIKERAREQRVWRRTELVATMRASELVISKALGSLVAAGLVSAEDEGVVYMPVSPQVANLVERTESLYAARPDAVRRAIVSASVGGLAAFADAFRLRKD